MSKNELSNRFNEKVAFVTGGTAGIGEAASLAFANEGAQVVLVGRNSERGHNVVERIKKDGGAAEFIETDVSNALEVQELIKIAVEKYGRLDVAFNNATFTINSKAFIKACFSEYRIFQKTVITFHICPVVYLA